MKAIVQTVLQKMGTLSQPHLKVMTTLLMTILLLCGKVNFTNLSRYSPLSEKTYRRFFAKGFNFCRFNQILIEQQVPENHGLLAVMDASFNPKSGKKTFGLDFFYNGCRGQMERGLEASLIAVVDCVTRASYALNVQQTYAQQQNPLLTRTDYALIHLSVTRQYLAQRVRYLAVDAAYATHPFITGAVGMNLQVISKLRQNANLRYGYSGEQNPRGRPRKYDGKVDFSDVSRLLYVKSLDGDEDGIHLYTQVVWHVSLKRMIRLVYLLDQRKPDQTRYALLFSTDLNQSAEEILEFYRLRFQIEFIFRDAKQFTGFSDCQARNENALDFHLNVSLMALNVARAEQRSLVGAEELSILSMASVKRRALNDYLLDLFIDKLGLCRTLIKSHINFQDLRNHGVIRA